MIHPDVVDQTSFIPYDLESLPAASYVYAARHRGGRLVQLVGGSGAGKDTLLAEAGRRYPFTRVPQTTSRVRRVSEQEGVEHFFMQRSYMEAQWDHFVALAEYPCNGELYGIDGATIDATLDNPGIAVCAGGIEFIPSLRRAFPNFISVYVSPPSQEVLRERLLRRDGSTLATETRYEATCRDIRLATENRQLFNAWIVNDDLTIAAGEFVALLQALEER